MNRSEPSLDTVAPLHPNHPYDMKEIIHKVVDDGNFFELQPNFAKNIIIGKLLGFRKAHPRLGSNGRKDGWLCGKSAPRTSGRVGH